MACRAHLIVLLVSLDKFIDNECDFISVCLNAAITLSLPLSKELIVSNLNSGIISVPFKLS